MLLSDTVSELIYKYAILCKIVNNIIEINHLYDYFSPIFQNETSELKDIYLRCETAQRKISDYIERNILKTLSIIYMINDFAKIPPTIEMISLCLNLEINVVGRVVNELINETSVLKKSSSSS